MSSNILNPQSLNLYGYALNNPLVFIDTDGLELVRAVLSNGQSVVVDRSIAANVISLVGAAAAAGLRVTVTSGFRSTFQQQALYDAYKAGKSKYPAARPGTSGHNSGQSIDISTQALTRAQLAQLARIAKQNGLPFAGAVDAVHFGAGFGVPISPELMRENNMQPVPQSTIIKTQVITTFIVDRGDAPHVEPVPSVIPSPTELTPSDLPPPPKSPLVDGQDHP